ncbi:MAG: CDP-glycerol glycerophosphotransferase family protein, partial [Balneolaceae bacterium]|nr:CDP-glycerol glycerophosphotransferase family protein [Balneolaceae bacterium]
GSAKRPNDQFMWQCFGPWDFKHRTKVSRIHPDNCRILGAASHDYLYKPLDPELAQPYYPFDVVDTPTVLIAPTWHYGEVFSHWGNDRDLFPRLIEHISNQGANIILRLHDSFRFDKQYRTFLDSLADTYDNVMLKYKDQNPDNLLDLQISDMLITNFSSIANLFYATGRPTIHIYPVKSADEEFLWRNQTFAGVYKKRVNSAKFIWKLSPEKHGGLLANDFKELTGLVDHAIANPDCCRTKAKDFLRRYMIEPDGQNCERTWNALVELVEGAEKPQYHPTELLEMGT